MVGYSKANLIYCFPSFIGCGQIRLLSIQKQIPKPPQKVLRSPLIHCCIASSFENQKIPVNWIKKLRVLGFGYTSIYVLLEEIRCYNILWTMSFCNEFHFEKRTRVNTGFRIQLLNVKHSKMKCRCVKSNNNIHILCNNIDDSSDIGCFLPKLLLCD